MAMRKSAGSAMSPAWTASTCTLHGGAVWDLAARAEVGSKASVVTTRATTANIRNGFDEASDARLLVFILHLLGRGRGFFLGADMRAFGGQFPPIVQAFAF